MQFLIATHGKMASGVLNTLQFICGNSRRILTIDAYAEDNRPVTERLDELLNGIDDTLLVFTDLAGGSVNREVMLALRERNAIIITDFNLALLLELATTSDDQITEERIAACIEMARQQMGYFKMTEKEIQK